MQARSRKFCKVQLGEYVDRKHPILQDIDKILPLCFFTSESKITRLGSQGHCGSFFDWRVKLN